MTQTQQPIRGSCTTALQADADYVREVTARYIGPRRKSIVIAAPALAADFMRSLLKDYAREHFLALYLSGSHRVLSYSLVSLGSANATTVHPREVFQPAILVGACGIVVGHNHPSGDLIESRSDIDITERLKKASDLLGITLLDHVIFSTTGYCSLRDEGRFMFD